MKGLTTNQHSDEQRPPITQLVSVPIRITALLLALGRLGLPYEAVLRRGVVLPGDGY